ncbi:hypothetical protein MHYP_G00359240 [Metynnis hypsauchen]
MTPEWLACGEGGWRKLPEELINSSRGGCRGSGGRVLHGSGGGEEPITTADLIRGRPPQNFPGPRSLFPFHLGTLNTAEGCAFLRVLGPLNAGMKAT